MLQLMRITIGHPLPRNLSLRLMNPYRLPVLLLATLLITLPAAAQQKLPVTTLSIGMHLVKAEVAVNDDERSVGLMFRKEMAQNEGMVFRFPTPKPVCMWMKNTYIPLDMVFLRGNGSVLSIVPNTTPQSLDVIQSEGEAQAVLELAAGTAARIGLAPGDKAIHRLFGNGP